MFWISTCDLTTKDCYQNATSERERNQKFYYSLASLTFTNIFLADHFVKYCSRIPRQLLFSCFVWVELFHISINVLQNQYDAGCQKYLLRKTKMCLIVTHITEALMCHRNDKFDSTSYFYGSYCFSPVIFYSLVIFYFPRSYCIA